MTPGASAPYNGRMKRAAAAVALVLGALTVAGSTAVAQPKLSRSQAVERLGRALGAKPRGVQLVWADERTTDVVLEWTAYSRHARIRVLGGPAGATVSTYYRGPAEAWLGADGGPPEGVGSVRPLRGHHILPLRSTTIPASLVSALARNGALVSLAPLHVEPTIDRVQAISQLRSWGDRKRRLQGIWLVRFQHGAGRERLAWMAVTLHARVPILGCRGAKCTHWYTSPLASFLDARSGKGIEALTINGWKPQLPPAAGALADGSHARPSPRTDLQLARNARCRGLNTHLVGPKVFSRFHAVTAVLCTEGVRTYPGQGQWEVKVRKVALSGVPAWQRYFEQPDEPNSPPKNALCSLVAIVIPVPTFVDARGRALVPRTPVDRCGHPVAWPNGEKSPRVRWHVVWVHRIRQLVTAAALAAHCPMRVGNTVAWAGPPRDSSGGRLFSRAPRTVRVCVYRTPATNFATGNFVRGFRLDATRTRRLLGALTGPGPRRGCPKQRTFAGLGGGPRFPATTVELGGCWRVERPDRLAGTANRAVAREILGGA